MFEWILLVVVALVASSIAGVVGFGAGVAVLPLVAIIFGAEQAVPIVAVALIIGNASRAAFSFRDIDWRAALAYGLPSVALSVLGSAVFLSISPKTATVAIALAILLMIPARRALQRSNRKVRLAHLPFVGGVLGFVSGATGASGPLAAPFLIGYGLVKAAYVGTDAVAALATHAAKTATYAAGGAVDSRTLAVGASLGGVMIVGAFIGRRLIDRIPAERFIAVVEIALAAIAVYMLATAVG